MKTRRIALLAPALAMSLPLGLGACSEEPQAPVVAPEVEEPFESLPDEPPQPTDEPVADETGNTGAAAESQSEGMASGSNQPGETTPDPSGSKLIKADPPR